MIDASAGPAARAFRTAMQRLAAVVPGSLHQVAPGGTLLAFTGSQIPLLNTVMSVSSQPDTGEMVALVEKAAQFPRSVPWTIRLRGEATEELERIAGDYGLRAQPQPFMVAPLTGGLPDRPNSPIVRRIAGDEYETFAKTLGAAFGAPPFIISDLYRPAVLDAREITAYLAEVGGIAVAAGLGVVTDGHLGLINIATRPEYRRLGHGRELTETIMRDGRVAGAHTAYLHPSLEAERLFESAGFRTVEDWTLFA
ncbi:GNAT family N-acetyltransferase [Streptomyces sp. NBC_01485]|uniref:GNAT family N-acetyltransferase n=1 Tax=Streptomyces sp. NBC_01485 TaxID=2903884 RepID=UPI002E33911C|nr:GNAT family N-acetyltransferase [Streptomyces sp. NBC_01485]